MAATAERRTKRSKTDEVGQLLYELSTRVRVARALALFGTLALPCATLWLATPLLPFETRPWSHLLLALPFLSAASLLLSRQPRGLEALADRRLGLSDGLRTLTTAREAEENRPYIRCLRTDLNLRLRARDLARALPPARIRGVRLWLFPLIFLLLLRFALPDFLGSTGPAGFGGGQGGPGEGSLAGGGGQGPGGVQARGGGADATKPPRGLPAKSEEEPPKKDEGPGVPPGPLPKPERFKDVFVPPVVDVEGPRKEKEIAAVEAPAGGELPKTSPRLSRERAEERPPQKPSELSKAAEEALARRRVDPAEARFVRRYFEVLGRESK